LLLFIKEKKKICFAFFMYSKSFSKLRANNDPGLSQLLIPSPASSFVPELLDIYSNDNSKKTVRAEAQNLRSYMTPLSLLSFSQIMGSVQNCAPVLREIEGSKYERFCISVLKETPLSTLNDLGPLPESNSPSPAS
jgi:hypothetical protein